MDGLVNDAGAALGAPQTAPPLALAKYVVGQTLGPSDKVTWLGRFPGAGWQADHIAGCCVKTGPSDKGQGFSRVLLMPISVNGSPFPSLVRPTASVSIVITVLASSVALALAASGSNSHSSILNGNHQTKNLYFDHLQVF